MEEQIRQLQHANSTLQREKTDMHNTMVHLQFEQRDYARVRGGSADRVRCVGNVTIMQDIFF